MKYKIAIVEDDLSSVEVLKSHIEKYSKEKNEYFDITVFYDGDEITWNYQSNFDIIFLDIEMKRMEGMSTAKFIRELDKEVIIIFVTNMGQYAIKGYSVDALSFLLKPLPYFAFSQELSKSLEKIKSRDQKFILIQSNSGIVRLRISEIYYIESLRHNLIIYTKEQEYSIRGTMKKMEEKLFDNNFFRCNNGYLVNLAMVVGVDNEDALVGNYRIKISRPKKKKFMEALTAYIGDSL